MRRAVLVTLLVAAGLWAVPTADGVPVLPPLRTSPNVELVTNVPGSFAGLVFKDHYAFATGWATGLVVLDIADPASPLPVGVLPLPHFENEDVDLCGDTLLISNDREKDDYGAVLYVIDIADPTLPQLRAALPLGLTGDGRGPGHIANFVSTDCTQAWIDGGNEVAVIDLADPSVPALLGSFQSYAAVGSDSANPAAFLASHDSELDGSGTIWSVGGGGVAGYQLTDDPLQPRLVSSSGMRGVNVDFDATNSPYNDFILHNTKRADRQHAPRHRGGLHRPGRAAAGKLPRAGQVRDVADRRAGRHAAARHVADRAQRVPRRRGSAGLEGAGHRELLVALVRLPGRRGRGRLVRARRPVP